MPLTALISHSPSLAFLAAAVVVALVAAPALRILFLNTRSSGPIRDLNGISFLVAWSFFTKRYDFMWSNFKKTGAKMFRFRVLNHTVVALSGDTARKFFYNEQGLDLIEGYRMLMGGIPELSDVTAEPEQMDVSASLKTLYNLLRKERINQFLPTLLEDVQRRMEDWGKEGVLNPFKEVYELIFQTTVRVATCRELSENKKVVSQLDHCYWTLEKSATPFALLFPSLPCPAKKAKQETTRKMYDILSGYVNLRRNATEQTTDAIDVLIAGGDSDDAIIGTFLRRNLGKDMEIEGATIRRGEFVAFSGADVHHDPEIYPEPLLFDPGRYDEGRAEDKKVPLGYVAWGAGRHPCAGMRIASLEIKLVLALIFAGYNFEIVNAAGKLPSVIPRQDKNDIQRMMAGSTVGRTLFLEIQASRGVKEKI
ncbi:hypothetical protein C0995_012765 [Termitomyces sp. Mi166|nr:hypothetical protein C0995_012765 [Termitomyces sp. Mi166\